MTRSSVWNLAHHLEEAKPLSNQGLQWNGEIYYSRELQGKTVRRGLCC
jgi:hypothetical protein